MSNPISPQRHNALLDSLEARFLQTMRYHPRTSWQDVRQRLEHAPEKLEVLFAMEASGGEPNIVDDPEYPSRIVWMDCASESPAGRRSLCYDQEALLGRRSSPPEDSAMHRAEAMGITLLSQAQYRALQSLGEFDLKTSSWVLTPVVIRSLGGALFCDRRYGQVFTYHNGADSYYANRGFRGYFIL
jgi:hypothetical protein